jgi:hypothetical protein
MRLRARLAAEGGFTLVELLVSASTGTIVMLALFGMVDAAMPAGQRVQDRVESTQRGRVALEKISRDLRSAVCVPVTGSPARLPLVSVGDNQITFYSFRPTPAQVAANPPGFTPSVVQLVYDAAAKTLTRKAWGPFTPGPAPPDPTTATPDSTEVVLNNLGAKGEATNPSSSAFFGFYAADAMTSVATAGITATQLASIARVRLSFRVGPLAGAKYSGAQADFNADVAVRLPPDYANGVATGGPACRQ